MMTMTFRAPIHLGWGSIRLISGMDSHAAFE